MKPSRQVIRRQLFAGVLAQTNQRYGGEPRKARRGISRTLSIKLWREKRFAA